MESFSFVFFVFSCVLDSISIKRLKFFKNYTILINKLRGRDEKETR